MAKIERVASELANSVSALLFIKVLRDVCIVHYFLMVNTRYDISELLKQINAVLFKP
jgi:hypothetical protein